MSHVYEALRRAAEAENDGRGGLVELPPAVDFVDESFPAEVIVGDVKERRVDRQPSMAVGYVHVPADEHPQPAEERLPSEPRPTISPGSGETFDRIAVRYEGKTVIDSGISSQSREQYRRLAAALHHAQATNGVKVVMVTSAMVGEGKTLTAANVALTLSQSYQKNVLLVDADLRRPSLQAVFGIRTGEGLAEGLTSSRERAVPVHQVSSRLGILQAGRPTSDPIAALTSERMRRMVDEARKSFDWIILDTPPVALLTDASLVSSMTDGAIIVVKAEHTPYDLVERAVAAIGRDRTLGVVLNHAELPTQGTGYYGDYDYYYGGAPK